MGATWGAIGLPPFSPSSDRIYFLDGNSTIRYVGLDGSSGTVKDLGLTSHQEAAFAVSPNDQTIAVAIIDYTSQPYQLRVYRENLVGFGSHQELFTSTTTYEWPIGWVGTQLLFAVGPAIQPQVGGGPYSAYYGYRLADANGNLIRAFCAPSGSGAGDFGSAWGPVFADGAACWGGTISSSDTWQILEPWGGGQTRLPDYQCPGGSAPGDLKYWTVVSYSPDRKSLLCAEWVRMEPNVTFHVFDLAGRDLARKIEPGGVQSTVAGFDWIGNDHVVVGGDILDIKSGSSVPIPWPSSVQWVVPGELY